MVSNTVRSLDRIKHAGVCLSNQQNQNQKQKENVCGHCRIHLIHVFVSAEWRLTCSVSMADWSWDSLISLICFSLSAAACSASRSNYTHTHTHTHTHNPDVIWNTLSTRWHISASLVARSHRLTCPSVICRISSSLSCWSSASSSTCCLLLSTCLSLRVWASIRNTDSSSCWKDMSWRQTDGDV